MAQTKSKPRSKLTARIVPPSESTNSGPVTLTTSPNSQPRCVKIAQPAMANPAVATATHIGADFGRVNVLPTMTSVPKSTMSSSGRSKAIVLASVPNVYVPC